MAPVALVDDVNVNGLRLWACEEEAQLLLSKACSDAATATRVGLQLTSAPASGCEASTKALRGRSPRRSAQRAGQSRRRTSVRSLTDSCRQASDCGSLSLVVMVPPSTDRAP
jgi:hypothetical protein